jgi:hypothetical protein
MENTGRQTTPSQPEVCPSCKGMKRVGTDLWDTDTRAYWIPCSHCCPDECKAFYASPNQTQLNWFTIGRHRALV